jgi:7-cyano-7-deazaguanine synthase
MTSRPSKTSIGVLFSGGLDSAILLGHLVNLGRHTRPLYIQSGLVWEPEELDAVNRYLTALSGPLVQPLVTLELPVGDLYGGSHWSITGRDVPDESSPDEAVYLHGRNALLVVKAGLWCQLHGIEELALGVLRTNPFFDASAEFFRDLQRALNCRPSQQLGIQRPFAEMTKRQVMELGRGLPLELTFSCIAPVGGLHCGHCNKCAERSAAFRLVEMEDPTPYVGHAAQ